MIQLDPLVARAAGCLKMRFLQVNRGGRSCKHAHAASTPVTVANAGCSETIVSLCGSLAKMRRCLPYVVAVTELKLSHPETKRETGPGQVKNRREEPRQAATGRGVRLHLA